MKRKYKRNIAKLRRSQGCLTDCVAYWFNLHPENVPYFVYPREGWFRRLKDYFKKRGYSIHWLCTNKRPKRGTHIVIGDSLRWKTSSHAVVYKNGNMVYNPAFPDRWHKKRITHRLMIKKIIQLV